MAADESKLPLSSTDSGEGPAPLVESGRISSWLTDNGFAHEIAPADHLGIEVIKVDAQFLIPISTALLALSLIHI